MAIMENEYILDKKVLLSYIMHKMMKCVVHFSFLLTMENTLS